MGTNSESGWNGSRCLNSPTFQPREVPPRAVYVHVPFCRHRCGYCNFSLTSGRDYLIERFLQALETEIGWLSQAYEIDTLFFGGGTPSHLSPEQLARLGKIVRSRFVFNDDAEVTAECNPNDLDDSTGEALGQIGVNRISLGVQSLDPKKLKRLERDHSLDDIKEAIAVARRFSRSISLDLIFAAPEETLRQWQTDLDAAMDLGPDHVSTYELTYEKGTRFWARRANGELNESEEDLRAEMYTLTIDRLSQLGIGQYEISNFAKRNHRSSHNLAYWTGDPYFAFGPGASRFVDGIRETNHQSTMQYLKMIEANRSPVADREHLQGHSAARERLAIGLRMTNGLDEREFAERTGHSIPNVLGNFGKRLIDNELLVQSGENWRLSRQGILVCDWIAGEIVGRGVD